MVIEWTGGAESSDRRYQVAGLATESGPSFSSGYPGSNSCLSLLKRFEVTRPKRDLLSLICNSRIANREVCVILHSANHRLNEPNDKTMKKHTGMRPQDILVLLKLAAYERGDWFYKDVAHELGISGSEVSESVNRSKFAGLVDQSGRKVRSLALMDFLVYGLKYVFPAKPGELTRGMPTAHSAPPLSQRIRSEQAFVWPMPDGETLGFAVEPLYQSVTYAAGKDPRFYELMSLVEALRVGKARESKIAVEELKLRILN